MLLKLFLVLAMNVAKGQWATLRLNFKATLSTIALSVHHNFWILD